MPAPKTRPTHVSVESHIAAFAKMWGPSIIGFGRYHYKYASGHEGDSALAAFAARGREIVVYIADGFEGRDDLLARLGKHRTGKVCVYIRRLADVDLKVLETLISRSVAETERRYPRLNQD
jgi:hypothetical protein